MSPAKHLRKPLDTIELGREVGGNASIFSKGTKGTKFPKGPPPGLTLQCRV